MAIGFKNLRQDFLFEFSSITTLSMCFSATRYSSALENSLDSGESFGAPFVSKKEREKTKIENEEKDILETNLKDNQDESSSIKQEGKKKIWHKNKKRI